MPLGRKPQSLELLSEGVLERIIISVNAGVEVDRTQYKGIQLRVDNGIAELFVRKSLPGTVYFGLDALLKLLSGNTTIRSIYALFMKGNIDRLVSEDILVSSELTEKNELNANALKEFSAKLGEMSGKSAVMMKEWSTSNKEELHYYMSTMVSDVAEENVERIVQNCLVVVDRYKKSKKIKEITASQLSIFIATVLGDHIDRLKPAYHPSVNHNLVKSIRRDMDSIKIDPSDLIPMVSNFSMDSSQTGSRMSKFIKGRFRTLLGKLNYIVSEAINALASESGDIADAIMRILKQYMEKLSSVRNASMGMRGLAIGGRLLFADDAAAILGSLSETIESVISAIAIIRNIAQSLDAAKDSMNVQYLERVLASIIMSGESQADVGRGLDEISSPFISGLRFPSDVAIPKSEDDVWKEYPHEQEMLRAANLKILLKDMSLSLVDNRMYTDAIRLAKYAATVSVSSAVSGEIERINNLMTAMGSMRSTIVPSMKMQYPFRDVAVVVMGKLKDSYRSEEYGTQSIESIAIPLMKALPTINNHLELLESVEGFVFSYTMNNDMYDAINRTLNRTFEAKISEEVGNRYQKTRDRVFVLRRFKDSQHFSTFLNEEAMLLFAIALNSYEPGGIDLLLENLFSDTDFQNKADFLTSFMESLGLESMAAINEDPTLKHIGIAVQHDLDELGMPAVPGAKGIFHAACQLYRTCSMYSMLNKRLTNKARHYQEGIYKVGEDVAMLIKDGKLDDFKSLVTAAVRSDSYNDKCPFGLSIPSACKCVGKYIDKMQVILPNDSPRDIDEKRRTNRLSMERLERDNKKCEKCKYARSFMQAESGLQSVVCNYGEANAGVGSVDFTEGVGAAYPTSFWAGLFTIPSALGPEARDSWFARSPGATPFGMTQVTLPGL